MAQREHRVLVVYENAEMAEVVSEWFRGLGYLSRAIGSIPAAVREMPSFAPDIVMLHDRSVAREEVPMLRTTALRRPYIILHSLDRYTDRWPEVDAFVGGYLNKADIEAVLQRWRSGAS